MKISIATLIAAILFLSAIHHVQGNEMDYFQLRGRPDSEETCKKECAEKHTNGDNNKVVEVLIRHDVQLQPFCRCVYQTP
uniref:SLPTX15 n=1 Tax=Scolopendra viridis TaxID=118503 RepID=A0A4D5RA56_SCOVI